ncbi:uncharacterized protein L3040_002371 [Drepanopeziza brunnea f. sp. 'multigermtubi']|uniref:uncharacterized protein n=1 Tax=Drepanopeziza brunnea f. sp. 'multigermtubi' TaxID=698441 RepID=UPI002384425A|nr:hypothetical protein L3040_002371 [Drepanopeziza brunnea f. sp. 'multigermtubi']
MHFLEVPSSGTITEHIGLDGGPSGTGGQRPVSHRDMMIDPVLQALSLPLADQQFQSLPDVAATECVINKVNSLATAEDTEDTQMAGTGEEVEEEDEDEENYYLFVPPRHPRMR